MSFLKKFFHVPVPQRPAVPGGKTRICVSGFGISHNVSQAQKLAAEIAKEYPDKYETWFYFSTFDFKDFLVSIKKEFPEDQQSKRSTLDSKETTIATHRSAPFVWFETGDKSLEAIGGRDMFCEWAGKEFADNESIQSLSSTADPPLSMLFFDNTTPGGTWMSN